jgi:hypothetical protein
MRLMTSPRSEKPARLEEALAYNTRPRDAREEQVAASEQAPAFF